MELITIDAFWYAAIIGTFLPLLTGLLTKLSAPSWVKSTTLLLLSAVQGLIVNAQVDGGGAVISKEALMTAFIGFVAAAASYHNVFKPTGIAEKVQVKTERFGLG